jgi:hypothetical protein
MGNPARRIVALVALTVVVSSTTTALANHLFPDVPTSSAFHTEIDNIVGAGCATGFDDGTFRPLSAPNRGQFAAWMNRCGGRIMAEDTGSATVSTSGPGAGVDVGSADITAGATGDAATGGFVLLMGTLVARTTNPAACPCFVQAVIQDTDADVSVGSNSFVAIPQGATDVNGEGFATIPLYATVPVEPDSTRNFAIHAFFQDANVGSVTFNSRLTAIYAPFGPTGTDDLYS